MAWRLPGLLVKMATSCLLPLNKEQPGIQQWISGFLCPLGVCCCRRRWTADGAGACTGERLPAYPPWGTGKRQTPYGVAAQEKRRNACSGSLVLIGSLAVRFFFFDRQGMGQKQGIGIGLRRRAAMRTLDDAGLIRGIQVGGKRIHLKRPATQNAGALYNVHRFQFPAADMRLLEKAQFFHRNFRLCRIAYRSVHQH